MGKKTILAADDQAGQRMILDMLLSSNYDVTIVSDGKEVLEHLKDYTPNLIILDIHMPFMDGLEICDRVKRVKRFKNTPVIILTASDDDESERLAHLSRADAFVTKPLAGKRFSDVVEQLLKQHSDEESSKTRSS